MLAWLLTHQLILVLVILLDGLVLNLLDAKHRSRQRHPDLAYYWRLSRQGAFDGVVAIGLTALALLSAALLVVARVLA